MNKKQNKQLKHGKTLMMLAAMLMLCTGAWAQSTDQTIHLNDNDNYTTNIGENITQVTVDAFSDGIFGASVTLAFPEGCLLKTSGYVTSGMVIIEYGGEYDEHQPGGFSNEWIYTNVVTVNANGNPVSLNVSFDVYNGKKISDEAELAWYLGLPNDPKNLGLDADITLSNYLGIVPSQGNVVFDLQGHTLSRSLQASAEHGHVIWVKENGHLNLKDSSSNHSGRISGGWATNGGGILNNGSLTLHNVNLIGNLGAKGAHINNSAGATLVINGGSLNSMQYHSYATEGGGIWNAGSLTIDGCTIQGVDASSKGGGIYLHSGCTANITNTNVYSNGDDGCKGGGIYVSSGATLNLGGNSTVDFNNDGGIYNEGTTSLSGSVTLKDCYGGANLWNNGILNMEGDIHIYHADAMSHGDDLYLTSGKVVNCGTFASTASIGVNMETPGVFTSGYAANNATTNHFYPSNTEKAIEIINGEGKMFYTYLEASWDADKKEVVYTKKSVPDGVTVYNICSFTSGGGLSDSEWFVAEGTGTTAHGLTCGSGVRNLILCDGANITINEGLFVNQGSTLNIYCQSFDNDMGILKSENSIDDWPGIGGKCNDGDNDYCTGTINIHGGYITAKGGENAAGIGNGYDSPAGGSINIYGGNVTAYGNGDDSDKGSAGIGGGFGGDVSYITIYGGTVKAYGAAGGAGIGSGAQKSQTSTITINGGSVEATGGKASVGTFESNVAAGAGIGCGGDEFQGFSITGGKIYINGGSVTARGGEGGATNLSNYGGGAGIGSGGFANPFGDIYITGGHVNAIGGTQRKNEVEVYTDKGGGAGIGGGYCSPGGSVYITGGFVFAQAGCDLAHAIGGGNNDESPAAANYIEFPDDYWVKAGGSMLDWDYYPANNRRSGFEQQFAETWPCTHDGVATFIDNGDDISFSNCYRCLATGTNVPYTIKALSPDLYNEYAYWNQEWCWLGGIIPGAGKNVLIKAPTHILGDECINAGNIAFEGDGCLTIEDGGQLIHTHEVDLTMQKSIRAYNPENTGCGNTDGWYFIASPVKDDYNGNMDIDQISNLFDNSYDLYLLYSTSAVTEWRNFKALSNEYTQFASGRGYLYANSGNVTLGFTGTASPLISSGEGQNNYVTFYQEWNLVGNPFTCKVYASRPFYKMNATRTALELVTDYSTTQIDPCEGIVIHSTTPGSQAVYFTVEAPAKAQGGNIQIALTKANTRSASTSSAAVIDNAIVSFNEGSVMPKLHFMEQPTMLYIPQDNVEYAIAYSEGQGEMPVNFKAPENGTYTLSVNPEGVEMGYLHLVDNMTGTDVDLLQTPNYSFEAKTTDNASRFRLVFKSQSPSF